MRKILVLGMILPLMLPVVAVAQEDWVELSGPDISAVLTDWTVQYENAHQIFFSSGRTLYDTGVESWGSWDVRGDQYCSQWPPAAGWACYDIQMETISGTIRFIGASGGATDGALIAAD